LVAASPHAPPLSGPRVARRRPPRKRGHIGLLVAVIVLIGIVEIIAHNPRSTTGTAQSFPHRPYAPQYDRNAEWAGPGGGLSDRAIEEIAQNSGLEIFTKFANGFNIQAHFDDARRLAAAAKAAGNPIKIYEYFSAAFWFTANESGWGSYAQGFNDAWLLRDANGQPIPFYGAGHRADSSATPVGYLVDLANPDYRAWAVSTIVSWMHAAPYSGILFDSANPLLTGTKRVSIGSGLGMNFEELLCGTAGVNTLSCDKLNAWNQGLTELISQTSTSLHKLGDDVIYNGIAPNTLRGPTRNVGLLDVADTAANEAFCLTPSTMDPARVEFQPLTDDLALMKQIADKNKKVLEITNYQASAKRSLGDYCLAGFLMGWQPGSSYYIFHTGYSDPISSGYPEVPEANLALGRPTASGYHTDGSVLSRQFENGFVAVNTGGQSADVRVPFAGVRFADGAPQGNLVSGQTVKLGAHDALYLLSHKYLYD
jgi:hypothetical protein